MCLNLCAVFVPNDDVFRVQGNIMFKTSFTTRLIVGDTFKHDTDIIHEESGEARPSQLIRPLYFIMLN